MAGTTLDNRNRRVGLIALSGALAMLGLGYASVPLYRLFCQVTGFGGTTQRVSAAEAARVALSDGTISIRFDANIERGMPWQFRPEQVTEKITLGGRRMATFIARNDSDFPVTGRATFNVEPEPAGKYFNKVQCFCFTEQTLQPHQEVRMPVVYFVDPKIREDEEAKSIEQITLSYTFHPLKAAQQSQVAQNAPKALDRTDTGG